MSVKNYASMVNPTGKLKDCLAEILKYSFPSRHICPLFLSIYLPSFGPALVMLGSVLVLARVEAIFITVACTVACTVAASWICAESSIEITGMLQLLLSSACTVKAFSAPHTTLPASSEQAGAMQAFRR